MTLYEAAQAATLALGVHWSPQEAALVDAAWRSARAGAADEVAMRGAVALMVREGLVSPVRAAGWEKQTAFGKAWAFAVGDLNVVLAKLATVSKVIGNLRDRAQALKDALSQLPGAPPDAEKLWAGLTAATALGVSLLTLTVAGVVLVVIIK